jgi:hypothetical protein
MPTTPTQRSLAKLRGDGWLCAIVEHWNHFCKIRQDLFGFADIIAFHPKTADVLLVQTTTSDHVSKRVAKITENHAAKEWLRWDMRRVVVHGWAKTGERGKRKTWTCREVELTIDQDCIAPMQQTKEEPKQ